MPTATIKMKDLAKQPRLVEAVLVKVNPDYHIIKHTFPAGSSQLDHLLWCLRESQLAFAPSQWNVEARQQTGFVDCCVERELAVGAPLSSIVANTGIISTQLNTTNQHI